MPVAGGTETRFTNDSAVHVERGTGEGGRSIVVCCRYVGDGDVSASAAARWTCPRFPRAVAGTNYRFPYDSVIPCWKHGGGGTFCSMRPVYELDHGKPYGNVLLLREAKLRNHVGLVPEYADAMILNRFEDTLLHGTADLLCQITRITGVAPSCEPKPAETNYTVRSADDARAAAPAHHPP